MNLAAVTRLPFVLPSSTRVAWVSDAAREVWLPRVEAARAAMATLEIESVAAGLRDAALRFCDVDQLIPLCTRAARRGLVARPLDLAEPGQPPGALAVAIGPAPAYRRLAEAFEDADERARMLGTPACCAARLVDDRRDGWCDPTWVLARGVGARPDEVVEARIAPCANTFLRPIGLHAVFHAPCAWTCAATLARAAELSALGRVIGVGQGLDWLDEMLSWPTVWSALHGLAEVKNPVLRMVTTTDATGEKIEIRLVSERYPTEGARAVRFPYADVAPSLAAPVRASGGGR